MTAAHLNTLDLPELIEHALRSAVVALTKLIDDPETQPETKRKAITDLLRFAARGLFNTTTPPKPASTRTAPPATPSPHQPTSSPRVAPNHAPTPAPILNRILTPEPDPPTDTADSQPTLVRGKHKRPRSRYKKRAKR